MREKPKGSWSLVIKEEEGEDKGEGEEERKKTRILAFGQQDVSGVEVLVAKPDDLSSIPGMHLLDGD